MKAAGAASRRSLSQLTRPIVRLADRHPVGRHRPAAHLLSRVRAVGVHVPVSRVLPVVGRLVAPEHQVCLVRLDCVVLPYYLSLLYYQFLTDLFAVRD
jgi:hypothetical protein